MLANKIQKFLSIHVIFLRLLCEKIIPDIKGIARYTSFSDLFKQGIAIPEDFLIIPLNSQEIRIREQHCLIEEIPPERWTEIEDIHLERSKEHCLYRQETHIPSPRHSSALRKILHFLFFPHIPHPMRVLKVIPHKRPSDAHEIGRSRDELSKDPPRRWESIDEEIECLKYIGLTRAIRSDEDIFLSPDKRHRFVVFESIESEGGEHEIIL